MSTPYPYPMTVFYGSMGNERDVATVNSLPIASSSVQDLLILDQLQTSGPPSGLYMHNGVTWRLILDNLQLGRAIVRNTPINVYSQLTAPVVLPAGAVCYVNGSASSQTTLWPGSFVYVVCMPDTANSDVFEFRANQTVSGHRVVWLTSLNSVELLTSQNVLRSNAAIGVTENAALSGSAVNVRLRGAMTESGWSFEIGKPVFCGIDGQLTQTPASTGFSLVVGVATGLNSVFINIKSPFVLS